MFVVTLPFFDITGDLTPIVLDALAAGATAERTPDNADTINLIFEDEETRDAYKERFGFGPQELPFFTEPTEDE